MRMTVAELAAYLRGLVDAGAGDAPVWARPDDDDNLYHVDGVEFTRDGDYTKDEPSGMLWLKLSDE